MPDNRKKRMFLKHKKSSALVVSITIHAVFIVLALSFVAVTAVKKQDVDFQTMAVKRPKMNLRKLRVPVKMRAASEQPKLRKQIPVKPRLNKIMPSFKMPEIVGVKGGVGDAGGGLGRGGSLGFSIPEVNLFGVKGNAEKIMIILDGDQYMSADELGGAYGFEVIKKECLKVVEGLPPTTLFNIVVYGPTRELFPKMVSASPENVQKARNWLMPLNQVKGTKTRYGVYTLGPGGTKPTGGYPFGKFKKEIFKVKYWNEPVMLAMQQQADMVYLLTGRWGFFGYDLTDNDELRKKWDQTSQGKEWAEKVKKGRELLDKDNAKRKAAGQPPRALRRDSELSVVRAYFPGTQEPPHGERVYLSGEDLVKAFREAYTTYAADAPKLGILKKHSHHNFSLNVIFFKQEKFKDDGAQKYSDRDEESFKELARALNGEFREVVGLKAIKSYVDSSSL